MLNEPLVSVSEHALESPQPDVQVVVAEIPVAASSIDPLGEVIAMPELASAVGSAADEVPGSNDDAEALIRAALRAAAEEAALEEAAASAAAAALPQLD